jgi:hypothetical protein
MQIKYKTGPKAGTTAHCPRSQEIQVLLDLGIIEEIAPPPPAPAVVSWGVHRGFDTQRPAIVGRCSREVCGMVRFEGKPEHAGSVLFLHGHAGSPPEKAPADVLNAYVAAVKENQGTLSPDEGNMLEFAHSKGDSGKRRKLFQGYGADGKAVYVEPWWKL